MLTHAQIMTSYIHTYLLKYTYIHTYITYTNKSGRPGSQDNEWVDAETFASWDIDYLKYDNCGPCKYGYTNTPAKIMQVTRMGDALRRWGAEGSGRSIFYSTEMGGEQLFNADICNSAREGGDITASWESILYELDVGSQFAHLAGPGYHNDFDMLEVGNGENVLFFLGCVVVVVIGGDGGDGVYGERARGREGR